MPKLAAENEKMGGNTKMASFVYANIFEKDRSEAEVNRVYGPYLTIEFEDQNAFEVLLVGSARQVAEKTRAFMKAGVSHFILDFSRHGIDSTQYCIGADGCLRRGGGPAAGLSAGFRRYSRRGPGYRRCEGAPSMARPHGAPARMRPCSRRSRERGQRAAGASPAALPDAARSFRGGDERSGKGQEGPTGSSPSRCPRSRPSTRAPRRLPRVLRCPRPGAFRPAARW